MTFVPNNANPIVDPRFYWQNRCEENDQTIVSGGKSSVEILVTATVADIDEWNNLIGVTTRSIISSDGSWIVTASVQRSDFECISQKPFVINLQIAKVIRPA